MWMQESLVKLAHNQNTLSVATETLMTKICKFFFIPIALAALTACSAHPEPIIDERGVNMSAYAADLEECGDYADAISIGEGAAKGGAGGAAVGAAAGAISGDAGRGAGYGAIYGAARSGNEADRDKRMVVKRCLVGRGYKVLN